MAKIFFILFQIFWGLVLTCTCTCACTIYIIHICIYRAVYVQILNSTRTNITKNHELFRYSASNQIRKNWPDIMAFELGNTNECSKWEYDNLIYAGNINHINRKSLYGLHTMYFGIGIDFTIWNCEERQHHFHHQAINGK